MPYRIQTTSYNVTPVCAASIATGTGPADHDIPSMNWWHRGEERYVEYGTSFGASRAFGIRQSLTDTIYNMNLEHLSKDVKTVFESLDDEKLAWLAEHGRIERRAAGEAVYTEGEPATHFYVVLDGTIALSRRVTPWSTPRTLASRIQPVRIGRNSSANGRG